MRSSAPKPPSSAGKNRKVVLWVVFGVALLLLVCGGIAFARIDILHVHFGYAKAVARYKAAGMPWTAADLAGQDVPESQNAGPRLFALAKKVEEVTTEEYPKVTGLLTPQSAKLLEDYLAPSNKLLDEYKPLAGLNVNWNKDWDLGPDILFPEFAQLKTLMKNLGLRMELRSYKGDVKGSIEDLRLGASVVKQTGGGGFLIGHLVEVAGRSILLQATHKSASYHLDDPVALESFAKAVKEFEPDPTIARGLRQEAYMGLAVLRNTGLLDLMRSASSAGWEEGPAPIIKNPSKVIRDGDPPSFVNRSLAVPLLNAWAEFGEMVQAKGDSLDTMVEAAALMDKKSQDAKGLSTLMIQILFPVFTQAANAGLKTAADERSTYAALKIAAAKARKGSLSQAEVTTLLPEDPYTHQPMLASFSGDSVKVWSLAEDKKDDKGLSRADARQLSQSVSNPSYDYVSELPWKPSLSVQAKSVNVK